MFAKTFDRLKTLPQVTLSMIALFWIYEFSQIIVGIFLNLFVFLQTKSLFALAMYNVFMYTGCLFGFVVWGFIMAQLQISMRLNYFKAFCVYVLSFLILLFLPKSLPTIAVFAVVNGLGIGMFWLGVHAYEMVYTDNSNRDFYSSMVSVGSQIFGIVAPLVATITFFLSEKVFHLETFTLLFWILPFIYFFGLPVIFKLPDYTPKKIPFSEMKRLFLSPKLNKARLYYIFGDFEFILRSVVIPFFALSALKTVINIGIFETVVGILSILAVLFLSHFRHEGNRIQIMLFAIFGIILAEICLFFSDQFWTLYVLYSLISVFFRPIQRVSEHVVDLASVEQIQSKDHDFYSGLLYRDFMLYLGRMVAVGFVLIILFFQKEPLLVGKTAIICIVFFLLLKWFLAKNLMKDVKKYSFNH